MESAFQTISSDPINRSHPDLPERPFADVSPQPSSALLSRKASCACGGGCSSCASSGLDVSDPNDAAEVEADRVAERVMRMPADSIGPHKNRLHTHSDNVINRKCDGCVDEDEEEDDDETEDVDEMILRKSAGDNSASWNHPQLVRNAVSSGGIPLGSETRAFFEPRFGYDLSSVRVHTGSTAERSARAVDARAYTLGNDIVFGAGEYRPDCASGRHLLAHELAHVVQSPTTGATLHRRPGKKKKPKQKKAKSLSIKDATLVMRSIRDMFVGRDNSDPANWKDPIFEPYRDLLVAWYDLNRHKDRNGNKLEGQAFIELFELAETKTQPIINLIVKKGGGTEANLVATEFYPRRTELSSDADSQRNILTLLETTTWFPWTPTEVDLDEFIHVASAKKSRPVVLQRGAGIKVGTAVAGTTYYPSKYEPRLLLWGSPGEGVFFMLDNVIYKQSVAGFSDDIIIGTIIKAAQDVAPFVELVKFMLELAISVTPVGWVYDVTMASKAIADGDWKGAALQLLPGPMLGKATKLAKATRVGGAIFRGGAKGAKLLGNAIKSGASFIGKGLGKVKGKLSRGIWLVAEEAGEAAGSKAYYFLDEADNVWRAIPEDEAQAFLKCSHCEFTPRGREDVASVEDELEELGGFGTGFEGPLGDVVSDPVEAGNLFNKVNVPEGAVAEVQLLTPTGRRPRVDLYVKGEAIISRKFPMGQLAEDELKALDYLQELYVKYPRKAPIRTAALAGEELQGVHVLQVPVQYMPLPKRVLEYARDRRIFIVDIEGKFYNPLLSVPD